MFTIKHYCLDSGLVQIVEVLADELLASTHLRNFCTCDHGANSVWYMTETLELEATQLNTAP